MRAKSLLSYPTLCDSRDRSPPGSSVPGDSPAKNTGVGCHALLQRIFPTRGLNPHLLTPAWQGVLYHESHLHCVLCLVAGSGLTLRDPMDCSPPGSSVHGIFQAKVLEWGAIAFSGFHLTCLYSCYSGPAKDQTLYLCSRYKTPCLPSAFTPLFLHQVTAKVFKRPSYLQISYHLVFTSLPFTHLSMSSDSAFIPGFQFLSSPMTSLLLFSRSVMFDSL